MESICHLLLKMVIDAESRQSSEHVLGKLVYIVSAGHSGSTLLDLVIGTIPGAFSTGELTYLPWELYKRGPSDPMAKRLDVCSCFKSFHECPVWRSIVERVCTRVGYNVFDDPYRFRIALLGPQWYRRMPTRLTQAVRLCYRISSRIRPIHRLWYEYHRSAIQNNWLLVDTICQSQDACVVVDSTKDSLRLRLLYQHRPKDVRAILLVRDPRGIAYSAQKRGDDPMHTATAWKQFYERATAILRQMHDLPIMRVQYETFCADPIETRGRIARFLGLPDPGLTFQNGGGEPHLVAGNPMRYRWNGQVRLDDAWKTEFVGASREQVDALHARLGKGWPILQGTTERDERASEPASANTSRCEPTMRSS
jgi:hypothetical protein